jgi:GH25 family lysozyme M1 (1,4-beta-N-acetylmuramidase)
MGYYNCVDVSEWNQEIDWNAAKADGVEYAFIRCGLGKYYLNYSDPDKQADMQAKWEETQGEDKYFQINMENAINAGIKVGAYFYTYARNADEARDEALQCIGEIEKYKDAFTFPLFLDVEEKYQEPILDEIISAFIEVIHYHGYNCGVYTSGTWYSSYFRNIDCDYIWIAYYGADDGVPHDKPDYCDIWQYSSIGTVDGIGEYCVDVDILYNTEMKVFIDNPQPQPEPPKPTPLPDKKVKVQLDVLSRVSTGGQVNTLKALLNQFGFGDNLPLDSDFDWDTEHAVNNYKEHYGLTVNGVVDEEMWNLILK